MPLHLPLSRRDFTALATSLPFAAMIPDAHAATPKDSIVIATQLDGLFAMDPGEAYDPTAQYLLSNVYDRLIRYQDGDLTKPIGGVAESWTFPDAGTLLFKLRPNQKFESGAPVTADDMAFSLQRVVLMAKWPSALLSILGWTKENVASLVTAPDAGTLRLKVPSGVSPSITINLMASMAASVIEKKVALANQVNGDLGNSWLKTHSTASGPYRLISWKVNESVIIEANPGYHGGPPKTKRIILRHLPETGTRRLLLEKGDVDMAWGLQANQLDAFADSKDVRVETFPGGGTWCISMNLADERLKNPKVRKALRYLVDYQGMCDTILKGVAFVQQTFLPIGFPMAIAYNPYKLDVEKAKALLAEAGYPDGFEIGFTVRNTSPVTEIAQSIQQTMGLAGVKVKVNAMEYKAALTEYRGRRHQMFMNTWAPDYLDPYCNASAFAYSASDADDTPSPMAWRNHYFDPGSNALALAAGRESDPVKLQAIYEELQKRVTDDGPYVIMFQPKTRVAMRNDVKGYHPGLVEDVYLLNTIAKV